MTGQTHVILDINGYFAPASSGPVGGDAVAVDVQVVHHQVDGLGFRILKDQMESHLCELKGRAVRRGEGEVPACFGFPAGTIAAFASTEPSYEFSVETTGCATPVGHTER